MQPPKAIIELATIDGIDFPIQISKDLEINPSDLEAEFCNQPQRFRYYGELAEAAKDEMSRLKVDLERTYAVIDEEVRNKNFIHNQEAKSKSVAPVKMTEKMVENCVITDPRYIAKLEEYSAARRQSGILKVYQDAMTHRLQMLIGIGANYRAEGNADPVILREAVKDRYRKKQLEQREEQEESHVSRPSSGKKPVGKKIKP